MKTSILLKLQAIILCFVLLISVLTLNAFAAGSDVLVDGEKLDDIYFKPFTGILGEEIDTTKDYEYVYSTLFNTATQKFWDLTKINQMTALAQQSINGHKGVKFSTDGTSKGAEAYFWNHKELDQSLSFGDLFGKYSPLNYDGIRLYFNKGKTNQTVTFKVMIGKFGGWWSDNFYTYEILLPKQEYDGYIYIPFTYFKNSNGVLDPSVLNFIGFKYNMATAAVVDTYLGELALYREGTADDTDSGKVNIGFGEAINTDDCMFYDSVIFNNSTADDWDKTKNAGFNVTANYTQSGYYPSDAKKSIKLSTTATASNPEIYFWNELLDSDGKSKRMPLGLLFGTNIDINDYDGLRLWVKTEDTSRYSVLTIFFGRMKGSGWWPNNSEGFYSYKLIIAGGFEGYVNIPFELFLNNKYEAVPIENFDFIAFKYGENLKAESNTYISNLQVYGAKKPPKIQINGIQLDDSKKYELLPSLIFADASQAMWDMSKLSGITATAGVTDANCIPQKGKTSVKIHTTGEKSSPHIYFWNELSDGGRRTHSRFWGATDCTEYDGIRFWVKFDENNTYSKLTMYLGQMFTGYWPKEEIGFFAYEIAIPRGGYEGYINIPFEYFVNNKGEKLNAQSINFLAFNYNERGFKETDFWISDLMMYRVAKANNKPADNAIISDGEDLQVNHIIANGEIVDDIGDEYLVDLNSNGNDSKDDTNTSAEKGLQLIGVIIAVAGILILAAITFLVILLIKKKRSK